MNKYFETSTILISLKNEEEKNTFFFRTATARGKAEQADYAAVCAREDSSEARACAQTFAPEFQQPGIQIVIGAHYSHLCQSVSRKTGNPQNVYYCKL